MSSRLGICFLGFLGFVGCDAGDRPPSAEREVTTINVEHGFPSLEAQARAPFYVVVSADETATVWRADGDDFVTVGRGGIGAGLVELGAAQNDPLLIYAEHDPPHGQMLEIVKSLRDRGFSSVALVAPGGWVPPAPKESAAAESSSATHP